MLMPFRITVRAVPARCMADCRATETWKLQPWMLLVVPQLAQLGGAWQLDRVQTNHTNSYFTSELYQLACTCRPALRETARRIGRRSFPSPRVQSSQSTIAPPDPAQASKWPCGAHQSVFDMTNGKRLVGTKREWSSESHEQTFGQHCAASSCGASALAWVCVLREHVVNVHRCVSLAPVLCPYTQSARQRSSARAVASPVSHGSANGLR